LFNVENVGNAPVVALDISPKFIFQTKERQIAKQALWEHIEVLKVGDVKKLNIMIASAEDSPLDLCLAILESAISADAPCESSESIACRAFLEVVLLYRNVLGACFKQNLFLDIFFFGEDEEKIESYLKLCKTTSIDKAEDLKEIDKLLKAGLSVLDNLEKLNEEISKYEANNEIEFRLLLRQGEFSIKSISEKEYLEELKKRKYPLTVGVEREKEESK
jgi:hypothetical protein